MLSLLILMLFRLLLLLCHLLCLLCIGFPILGLSGRREIYRLFSCFSTLPSLLIFLLISVVFHHLLLFGPLRLLNKRKYCQPCRRNWELRDLLIWLKLNCKWLKKDYLLRIVAELVGRESWRHGVDQLFRISNDIVGTFEARKVGNLL